MIIQDNFSSTMIRIIDCKDMYFVKIIETQERVLHFNVATVEIVILVSMLVMGIPGLGIIHKRDLLASIKRLAYSILSQLNSILKLLPSQETENKTHQDHL